MSCIVTTMTNPQLTESTQDAPRGKNWAAMTPREFDTQAKDQPLTLFGAPDECGSFDTLF